MAKHKALVTSTKCLACGGCISVCPQDAISMVAGRAIVDQAICSGCSLCISSCPLGAVKEVRQ